MSQLELSFLTNEFTRKAAQCPFEASPWIFDLSFSKLNWVYARILEYANFFCRGFCAFRLKTFSFKTNVPDDLPSGLCWFNCVLDSKSLSAVYHTCILPFRLFLSFVSLPRQSASLTFHSALCFTLFSFFILSAAQFPGVPTPSPHGYFF